eukprot:TRINITY_DN16926_c0_g1_i1.p1 TRINITY_DN16926_c0_g1~~TRINITY_DN16926_c0_g1_i1.p1  ORF type:complete len:150 (+),score=28.27 TRINITY_DN16926_c0_g1_i1:65-514(+)
MQTPLRATTDGAEPSGDFTWGSSLVPTKKAIIEDDESLEAPSDFWNWVSGLWHSRPKVYGLREEEGWAPGVGSIVEELSDCETDISTTASERDLAMLQGLASSPSSSLKALESGLLAHHHRSRPDCRCKFCCPDTFPQDAAADARGEVS